ncbi:hypothetical protein C2S52_000829 [Perilla frutescens var. hirtella]|nr:hypothetical protein C2S52_000829 [Perilla frutescens var. hirtella]
MAMKSVKFHAAMRERYPIFGCLVEFQNLAYQIQLQLGMAPPRNTTMALIQQDDQPEYNLVTYSYINNNNNANSAVMQSQMTTSQHILIPQKSVQDYNEMHSFFNNIDDIQSYIGPKEVYESSLDSSIRDSRKSDEQMAENELKNAAACFSLTSFN